MRIFTVSICSTQASYHNCQQGLSWTKKTRLTDFSSNSSSGSVSESSELSDSCSPIDTPSFNISSSSFTGRIACKESIVIAALARCSSLNLRFCFARARLLAFPDNVLTCFFSSSSVAFKAARATARTSWQLHFSQGFGRVSVPSVSGSQFRISKALTEALCSATVVEVGCCPVAINWPCQNTSQIRTGWQLSSSSPLFSAVCRLQ